MSRAGSESAFNPRVVVAVVAAGILAFAAFLGLFAYADDFRSGRDGRGHPLSVSAIGFGGIVKLIELQGEALDQYHDRLSTNGAPVSALAERARSARDRFDLLAAARALFSWKKDLIK